jgi:hypothetical protein
VRSCRVTFNNKAWTSSMVAPSEISLRFRFMRNLPQPAIIPTWNCTQVIAMEKNALLTRKPGPHRGASPDRLCRLLPCCLQYRNSSSQTSSDRRAGGFVPSNRRRLRHRDTPVDKIVDCLHECCVISTYINALSFIRVYV